eukprot:CAMPEP_0174828128 /NCGR_PEP_ID=MMETSP1114-20130205/1152_1 /TAXON_ID=312471 /ORGANISM="Neobodo designis, Strain CCAP 1951/1" /LENGTH=656 /DNA_ID=CAMNT_0016061837 /DNA_START=95 /DNA_END=2065 /DNA_ORIENTATION=+
MSANATNNNQHSTSHTEHDAEPMLRRGANAAEGTAPEDPARTNSPTTADVAQGKKDDAPGGSAAVAVGQAGSGAASAAGWRLMAPVEITSQQLTWLGAVGLASTVVTWWFVGHVHDNKAVFQYGDLYTGQVCAIFIGFGVWIAGALLYAPAVKAYVTGEEPTWNGACRRHMDDATRNGVAAGCEFVLLLATFFVCDRTTIVPRSKKHYDKDQFWFIWIMLMIAALFTLRRAKPPPKAAEEPKKVEAPAKQADAAAVAVPETAPLAAQSNSSDDGNFHVKWLQRDQTEEWKGWMQVMFLWYHYFEAKDIYNAIRLYIAAYVWMTGFGNFSYYYIRKDFSFERFCQMQWRLNFLVLWVCLLMANEYMLYYINMLHTYFTMLIYVGLAVWSQHNTSTAWITGKMLALFAFCFVMWDVPGVFTALWSPFEFLVQYHDPYKATRPVLHEWEFRSGLDHYIWIVGMITAFNHPNVDAWMVKVDALPYKTSQLIKWGVMGVLCACAYWYAVTIFNLPKKEYNALHPYTSFIPITLYILARNLFPTLRRWHMHLFEYLGKITLETYIAQFHVWMATTGVNGAPKRLLKFVPGEWPMVNFVVASAVFFVVSMRLFHNTNALKAFVLPPKSTPDVLRRNLILAGGCLFVAFVWAAALRNLASRGFE